MTKWQFGGGLLIVYAALCIASGIKLARFTLLVPRSTAEDASHYSRRVQQEFGALVENASITAKDGAVMKGWLVQPAYSNGESVVLLHGLYDNRTFMTAYGDMFLSRGYSVLLPDSRAHGVSDGALATYGILERDDVRRWAIWLRQRDPGCTYLLGESMGAAIGLEAAAVTPQLCAVVAESSFATFREAAYDRLGHHSRLRKLFWETLGQPALEVGIVYGRLRYGVNVPDASPERAVEESRTPILLIAGSADNDIPPHHARELERACAHHCSLWIVPGAGHGAAFKVAPVEFEARILQWFQEHDPSRSQNVARTATQRVAASTSLK